MQIRQQTWMRTWIELFLLLPQSQISKCYGLPPILYIEVPTGLSLLHLSLELWFWIHIVFLYILISVTCLLIVVSSEKLIPFHCNL